MRKFYDEKKGRGERNMSDEFNQNGTQGEVITQTVLSDKSKVVAALLCFFLGWLGMHRIYLGRVGSGIVIIVLNIAGVITSAIVIGFGFFIITGIWVFIDFFRILFGGLKDSQGRSLK